MGKLTKLKSSKSSDVDSQAKISSFFTKTSGANLSTNASRTVVPAANLVPDASVDNIIPETRPISPPDHPSFTSADALKCQAATELALASDSLQNTKSAISKSCVESKSLIHSTAKTEVVLSEKSTLLRKLETCDEFRTRQIKKVADFSFPQTFKPPALNETLISIENSDSDLMIPDTPENRSSTCHDAPNETASNARKLFGRTFLSSATELGLVAKSAKLKLITNKSTMVSKIRPKMTVTKKKFEEPKEPMLNTVRSFEDKAPSDLMFVSSKEITSAEIPVDNPTQRLDVECTISPIAQAEISGIKRRSEFYCESLPKRSDWKKSPRKDFLLGTSSQVNANNLQLGNKNSFSARKYLDSLLAKRTKKCTEEMKDATTDLESDSDLQRILCELSLEKCGNASECSNEREEREGVPADELIRIDIPPNYEGDWKILMDARDCSNLAEFSHVISLNTLNTNSCAQDHETLDINAPSIPTPDSVVVDNASEIQAALCEHDPVLREVLGELQIDTNLPDSRRCRKSMLPASHNLAVSPMAGNSRVIPKSLLPDDSQSETSDKIPCSTAANLAAFTCAENLHSVINSSQTPQFEFPTVKPSICSDSQLSRLPQVMSLPLQNVDLNSNSSGQSKLSGVDVLSSKTPSLSSTFKERVVTAACENEERKNQDHFNSGGLNVNTNKNELDTLDQVLDKYPAAFHAFGRHTVESLKKLGKETVLDLRSSSTGACCRAILTGFWQDTRVNVGDVVNVIGDFDAESTCCVTDSSNLIVVDPDTLISGTSIVSTMRCMRRVKCTTGGLESLPVVHVCCKQTEKACRKRGGNKEFAYNADCGVLRAFV